MNQRNVQNDTHTSDNTMNNFSVSIIRLKLMSFLRRISLAHEHIFLQLSGPKQYEERKYGYR